MQELFVVLCFLFELELTYFSILFVLCLHVIYISGFRIVIFKLRVFYMGSSSQCHAQALVVTEKRRA